MCVRLRRRLCSALAVPPEGTDALIKAKKWIVCNVILCAY